MRGLPESTRPAPAVESGRTLPATRGLWALAFSASLCLLSACGTGPRTNQPPADSIPAETLERRAEQGPVTLVVRVSPSEPRLSDLVGMEVVATADPDVEMRAPAFGQGVGDFLVRDYSEQPADPGAANQRRFVYRLEPVHAGRHLIRSVAIEYVDRRGDSPTVGQTAIVETEPLEVNVTSELGAQTPSLSDLEPMLPPEPLPGGTPWLVWVALGLTLIALVTVVITRRRTRRPPVVPPPPAPELVAELELQALLAEGLPARGLVKEFYLRLTGIVRRYIEETTGIRAYEQTTEEFLRAMRGRHTFSPERSVRLAEFLESADMVKYAGSEPPSEQIDAAVQRAREFIQSPRDGSTASAQTASEAERP